MPGKFRHEQIARGQQTIDQLAQLKIVIAGVGALGSNLADTLARQGAARLVLIDHDRVEEHNIGTQTYAQSDIGQFKADAMKKHLFRIAGVEADAVRKQLTTDNARVLLKDAGLVVDCLDNSASRQFLQTHARASSVPTLHAGLNVDYGEVIWDERYRVPGDVAGDVCDYPLARNLVLLTVTTLAETVLAFVSAGQRRNWTITLGDLAIRPV
jgi:molybdopterin/thiamine biosynthesis adenylyltransferase